MLSANVRDTAGRISRPNRSASARRCSSCVLVRSIGAPRSHIRLRLTAQDIRRGGAIGDGVVVDLSRLSALDAVDVSRATVRCGPGVLRDQVDAAARAVGLHFPVDPSSGAYCTVGGMASTNSAGAHTLRYGAMRP